jgi:hypothetical protein
MRRNSIFAQAPAKFIVNKSRSDKKHCDQSGAPHRTTMRTT